MPQHTSATAAAAASNARPPPCSATVFDTSDDANNRKSSLKHAHPQGLAALPVADPPRAPPPEHIRPDAEYWEKENKRRWNFGNASVLAIVEARTPPDRPPERCREKRPSPQPKFDAHGIGKKAKLLQVQRGRDRSHSRSSFRSTTPTPNVDDRVRSDELRNRRWSNSTAGSTPSQMICASRSASERITVFPDTSSLSAYAMPQKFAAMAGYGLPIVLGSCWGLFGEGQAEFAGALGHSD